ncbi:hypothetical protein TrispH2_009453 [Trichoplax sp. H2]|nr:hypothetical protein TrispH2_009453 [Trichoplax sp. H2]|eukprot:RDD38857.1 hypothetical protein TrispH2_009453 [Trichoplax sp. H2]
MSTSTRHVNIPNDHEFTENRSTVSSMNNLKALCLITYAIALIQIALAISGLILPCTFGIYIISFNRFGNTYWIAGPVLLYTFLVGSTIPKNNSGMNNISFIKMGAFLCALCIIAGFVILGQTLKVAGFLIADLDSDDIFHSDVCKIPLNQAYTPALLVTILQLCIHIFYFGVCIKFIRISNSPSVSLERNSGHSLLMIQPLPEEAPPYEFCDNTQYRAAFAIDKRLPESDIDQTHDNSSSL